MKIIRYFIIATIGAFFGAVALVAYIAFDAVMSPPTPWIVIHVKNNSLHDIIDISIQNKNSKVDYIGVVHKGSEIRIPIYQYGTYEYTIKFMLKNGAVCENKNGYIESGSRTIEWITDEGVINDQFKKLGNLPSKCVK